jgi:hypothetical protein
MHFYQSGTYQLARFAMWDFSIPWWLNPGRVHLEMSRT